MADTTFNHGSFSSRRGAEEPEQISSDVTVAGTGLAGVCAALAAARDGASVALVGDRPVLGGNSSSEMRMWTRGATGGENLYAEESGILGELKLENLYRNPEGNPYLWDEVLLDVILAEKNISLFLNTCITGAEVSRQGDSQPIIVSADGLQLGSERRFSFRSSQYIDATGDGTLAFSAGADFRTGREARDEYGEDLAPDAADTKVLGSSIFFQSRKVAKPVKFIPPRFACSVEEIESVLGKGGRVVHEEMSGTDFWWLEYGGMLDTVRDNQEIFLELKRIVYGVWNYIKNSGKFDAESLSLEWVGNLPSKRESRRFLGDYILTQHDIMNSVQHEDDVCYGGWYMDFHPPEGFFSKDEFCTQFAVPLYGIPMRCLYSRSVRNLLLAGRDISVTHAAFSSTRIMNTCALAGQAAGMMAARALRHAVQPAELYARHRDEVRSALVREDMFIPGCSVDDPDNLAARAEVSVSSVRKAENSGTERTLQLDREVFFLVSGLPGDAALEIKCDVSAPTELALQLYSCRDGNGFREDSLLAERVLPLAPGKDSWIAVPFPLTGERSFRLVFEADSSVSLHLSSESCTGFLGGVRGRKEYFHPCFRIRGGEDLFGGRNLLNGRDRPGALPNLWMSGPLGQEQGPEWCSFSWPDPVDIREIRLFFNPDLSRELVNTRGERWNSHHGFLPRYGMPPELVRSYSVLSREGGTWKELCRVEENRKRLVVHRFEGISTDALRIEIHRTWGGRFAELFSVRVY